MRFFSFLFLIFSVFLSKGQEPKWVSVFQAGGYCTSVDTDIDNFLYVAGEFYGIDPKTAIVNDSAFQYNLGQSAVIAKIDSSGKNIWVKPFESSWGAIAPKIRVDHKKNVVVALTWYDKIRFDTISITADNHYQHGLILKYDIEGNLVWYNLINANPGSIIINDLVIDSNDEIWIAGNFNGQANFESQNDEKLVIYKEYGDRGYFVRYDGNGNLKFGKQTENDYQLWINSIAVDKSSNIYLTGYLYGELKLGNNIINAYNSDAFLLKFNEESGFEWYKQIGNKKNDILETGMAVTLDKDQENVYITGSFIGTADFGGKTVSADDKNIFFAKYSTNGSLKWVKNMGCWSGLASYVEKGIDLITDKNDIVYLLGNYMNTATIENTTVSVSSNNYDNKWSFFIAKYKNDGSLIGVIQPNSIFSENQSYTLACDTNNSLYVGSKVNTGGKFGDIVFPAGNEFVTLGFVAKIENPDILNGNDTPDNLLVVGKDNRSFSVYPNPFNNELTIRFKSFESGTLTLRLTNILGEVIYINRFSINNKKLNIFIPNVPCGQYIAQINFNARNEYFKIIKLK